MPPDHGPPPIPTTCAHRPTIGGRVAPWVNVQLADGGVDFRNQHRARVEYALSRKVCQVCGTGLRYPMVLLGDSDSLVQLLFAEPPLHAECAVYTTRACPMVAGEKAQYATGPSLSQGPRGKECFDPGCSCGGWVSANPPGGEKATEPHPWFAVWATRYVVAFHPDGSVLGALVHPDDVLVVRLVSRPGEGRCWEKITDWRDRYERPEMSIA